MSIQVNVFNQSQHSRILVGRLWREQGNYHYQYTGVYLQTPRAIPLGPDLPLKRTISKSKRLFESFLDRIPSKQNPAYPEYCRQWGIDSEEKDLLVLLTTIGHRGPASFLFRKVSDERFDGKALVRFRKKLGLSVREMADFLDTQPATLTRTEKGVLKSGTLLHLCALLAQVPNALDWQLKQRGQYLHDKSIEKIKKMVLYK